VRRLNIDKARQVLDSVSRHHICRRLMLLLLRLSTVTVGTLREVRRGKILLDSGAINAVRQGCELFLLRVRLFIQLSENRHVLCLL
jgi:hypothetical protein